MQKLCRYFTYKIVKYFNFSEITRNIEAKSDLHKGPTIHTMMGRLTVIQLAKSFANLEKMNRCFKGRRPELAWKCMHHLTRLNGLPSMRQFFRLFEVISATSQRCIFYMSLLQLSTKLPLVIFLCKNFRKRNNKRCILYFLLQPSTKLSLVIFKCSVRSYVRPWPKAKMASSSQLQQSFLSPVLILLKPVCKMSSESEEYLQLRRINTSWKWFR